MPLRICGCRQSARNRLLREPLDAAENRSFGLCGQQAQLRELRLTRPVRGFPFSARAAALARFASAACAWLFFM